MTMVEPPLLSTNSSSSLVTGLPVVLPSWHDPAFIGPLMLGSLLQFGIFCIVLMQAVVYFARQGHDLNDGRLFQLYVAAIVLLTTSEITFGAWRIYNICVLLHPWSLLPSAWLEVVLNPIVVESVHAFFIFRCYKLSRSKLVLSFMSFMLLAQIAAALMTFVFHIMAIHIRSATLVVCFATAILDTVISATLLTTLWRQRTGRDEFDIVILRVIRITIESNVPCLICIIIILIGAVNLGTVPLGPLFHMAVSLPCPLYANALLTSLNARPSLRRQLYSDRDDSDIYTQDNLQFHRSDQSQRVSHLSTRRSVNQTRRGNASYDIVFPNTIDLTSIGRSGSDQTASKARSLVIHDGTMPDLRPDYSPTPPISL